MGAERSCFYAVKEGHHPGARGGLTTIGDLTLLNADLTAFVGGISPRSALFIAGDHTYSEFPSEMVHEKAQEPRKLYVAEDTGHVNLCDRTDRTPFDKLERFFRENL